MMRVRSLTVLAPILAATILSSGCLLKQSKHAQTYVLDPIAAQSTRTLRETPVSIVGVLKVTVPGWIDRSEVTGRTSGGEIVTDEFALWGEPIGRGIQRVVAENLQALLPDHRVVRAPFSPSLLVHHRVDVTITEAARQADGTVLVEARFAVLGPKGETIVQRLSSRRANAPGPGPGGAVSGTSEALGALSRDIADVLRALPPPSVEAKPTPAP